MTVTREEILAIIEKRDNKLIEWAKNNPQKLSISNLKEALKEWKKAVFAARKFSNENDPTFPKGELLFVYTMMNEYSAFRSYFIVSNIYIKKLERKILTK